MMSGLRDNEPDLAHCAKVLTDNGFRVIRPLEERASYATRERPSVGLVKVAIVDTETTGLDFWSDYMIEAAILIVEFLPETGELFDVVASYSGLEESPIGIPEDATAVSGISDSDVAGMKFDDSRIAEILQGVALVVAHNAEFDRPFLEDRFPAFANLPWACSRKGIRWESEGMGGAKLEYLCDRAGFHYAAHRAITDCRALLELLSMRLPRTGRPALKVLWDGAMESTFEVRFKLPPRSPLIGQAKARGARWNPKLRQWSMPCRGAKLAARLDDARMLLRDYADSAQLHVVEWTALNRFSNRDGTDVTQAWT